MSSLLCDISSAGAKLEMPGEKTAFGQQLNMKQTQMDLDDEMPKLIDDEDS